MKIGLARGCDRSRTCTGNKRSGVQEGTGSCLRFLSAKQSGGERMPHAPLMPPTRFLFRVIFSQYDPNFERLSCSSIAAGTYRPSSLLF